MSTVFDNDILIHYIAAPGLPGDGFTAPEASTIRADIDTILSRPQITSLDAVPDVDVPSPSDGQTLIYHDSSDTWQAGSISGAIGRVQDQPNSIGMNDVHTLIVQPGLMLTEGSQGTIYIAPRFGGTGANSIVARNDHTHTLSAWNINGFNDSGALSSGTRTLVSGSVSGLSPALTYRVSATLVGDLRGQGTGAGYSLPRVTLAGNEKYRFSSATRGEVRTVAGVDREYAMVHHGTIITGVSSFSYSATLQYRSGDPVLVTGGELTIDIAANR